MTTRQDTTVAELLREKRGKAYKTVTADKLGVSRQMYAQWDDGYAVPGDEWAEVLAAYLGYDEEEMALMLYRDRMRKRRSPDFVVPLSLDLGRRRVSTLCKVELPTVRAYETTDRDYRPIDANAQDGRIAA